MIYGQPMIRSSIGNSRTMQSSFNSQPSQTPGMLTSGEHEQFEPVLKQISALNFQKIFHFEYIDTGSRRVMGRILVQENPKRNFRSSWLRGDVRGDEALESARRLPKWQETGHPEARGLAPRGLQRIGLPRWQESKRHRDD